MKRLIGLIFLLATPLFAQYGRFQNCQLQTAMGQAVQGASVYFLTQPANTSSLTPLATVYSSAAGASSTNPVTTNGFGMCTAYLANGPYTVCYVSPYTGTNCYPDQAVEYGVATGITIGLTPVNSGTNGYVLYDNAGITGNISASTTVNGSACALGGSCTATAAAGTLTGTTLNSTVVNSSLTSLGTIGTGVWHGSAITNTYLANSATTVNGQTCTLGSSCTVTASASAVTVGSTAVFSGTSGYILYNNAGTLGNLATTGSGSVVLATSPTLVTPALGAATASSLAISSSSSTSDLLTISNTLATAYSRIRFIGTGANFTSGVGNASETTYGVANKFYWFDSTNTAMRGVIDSTGRWGIDNVSPSYTLDVTGTGRYTSNLLVGGTLGVTGTTTLTSLATAGYVTNTAAGVLGTVATIPNSGLTNSSTTVNGQTCTLGGSCTLSGLSATSITVGTTTVLSGTSGRILSDNGTLGEVATTGTGNVVLAGSPTITGTLTTGNITESSSGVNSFTVTGTGNINNALAVLEPSLSTGTYAVGVEVGTAANSSNNSLIMNFNNAGGSGSTSNFGSLAIYGTSGVAVYGTGDVAIGGFTDCGSKLCVLSNAVGSRTTITTGTSAVSTTCSSNSATAATLTGVTSTSHIGVTPQSDPSSVTGWASGSLFIVAVPSSNTVTWRVCNASSGSITPGSSITWNVVVL